MSTNSEATLPKLYRVYDIAEHMGVEEDTVRRWIREKQLPARKYGREYLVRADELDNFLAVK